MPPRAPPPRCFSCNYSLASLPDSATCPECGAPARDSLLGTLLHRADPTHLRTLRRGAAFLILAISILALSIAAGALSSALFSLESAYRDATLTIWPTPAPVAEARLPDHNLFRIDLEGDDETRVTHRTRDDSSRSILVTRDGQSRTERSAFDPEALAWRNARAPSAAPQPWPRTLRLAIARSLGLSRMTRTRAGLAHDGSMLVIQSTSERDLTLWIARPGAPSFRISLTAGKDPIVERSTPNEPFPSPANPWPRAQAPGAYYFHAWVNRFSDWSPLLALATLFLATLALTARDRGRARPTSPRLRAALRIAITLALLGAIARRASTLAFQSAPLVFSPNAPFPYPYGGWWLPLINSAFILAALTLFALHIRALFTRLQDRRGAHYATILTALTILTTLTFLAWPTISTPYFFRRNLGFLWQPSQTLTRATTAAILLLALYTTLRLRAQLKRHAREMKPA